MKRITTLLLVLVLVFAITPATSAASDEANDAAETLHELGLFQGKGTNPDGSPDYALDDLPTRNEAVTMLVRLLGKEEEAKGGSWETPFTDVKEWAKPYVGYAYANGLTYGTGNTTFGGSDLVSATQYLTFVLRALGYDSSTDFQWDKAWELTDKLGITNGEYTLASSAFTRGNVAIISLNALLAELKNRNTSLFEYLGLDFKNLYYNRTPSIPESSVIIEKYSIKSKSTGVEYTDASITYKASKYTNMANSYTIDQFFYSEFPQFAFELAYEIQKGLISCVEYNGNVYLYDVNAIQFFRQYGIEFYHDYSNYQYIQQELDDNVISLIKEPVDYTVSFSELSENAIIFASYDIVSNATGKTYNNGEIEIKSSAYTNMVTGYFLDEFFFAEFPDYEYTIKAAVNNGEIYGVIINNSIYLEAVNMIQFFKQYGIEFYHLSNEYTYKQNN